MAIKLYSIITEKATVVLGQLLGYVTFLVTAKLKTLTHQSLKVSGVSLINYTEVKNMIQENVTRRHPNLDILLRKHVVLTDKKRKQLISELSLDDKRYLGNWLLDNKLYLEIDNEPENEIPELDGELTFGDTTYEDGVEVFVNNRE